jgi:hypothetical protein
MRSNRISNQFVERFHGLQTKNKTKIENKNFIHYNAVPKQQQQSPDII